MNVSAPVLGAYVNPGANQSVQADLTTVPCGEGSWINWPTSYTYRWLRVSGTETEVPANNPTLNDASYSPTQEDVGFCLLCEVTAINVDGSATVRSNTTGYVQGKPKCIDGPTITPTSGGISGGYIGTINMPVTPTVFTVGSVWFFSGLPSDGGLVSFVWKLANPDGSILNLLAGGIQGSASYVCTPEDIGKRLYCEVTMANSLGSTTAISNMTDVLVQGTPVRYFGANVNSTAPGQPIISGWYNFVGNQPVTLPPLMPSPPMPPPIPMGP